MTTKYYVHINSQRIAKIGDGLIIEEVVFAKSLLKADKC